MPTRGSARLSTTLKRPRPKCPSQEGRDMSELTPKQACELCLALYGFPDAPPVAWAAKGTCGPVYWGLARDYAGSGSDAVVFRGSTTPLDFARDLLVTPTPFTHPSLGPIHAGFWQGME